jgi:hypothetical protein
MPSPALTFSRSFHNAPSRLQGGDKFTHPIG